MHRIGRVPGLWGVEVPVRVAGWHRCTLRNGDRRRCGGRGPPWEHQDPSARGGSWPPAQPGYTGSPDSAGRHPHSTAPPRGPVGRPPPVSSVVAIPLPWTHRPPTAAGSARARPHCGGTRRLHHDTLRRDNALQCTRPVRAADHAVSVPATRVSRRKHGALPAQARLGPDRPWSRSVCLVGPSMTLLRSTPHPAHGPGGARTTPCPGRRSCHRLNEVPPPHSMRVVWAPPGLHEGDAIGTPVPTRVSAGTCTPSWGCLRHDRPLAGRMRCPDRPTMSVKASLHGKPAPRLPVRLHPPVGLPGRGHRAPTVDP